MQVGTVVGTHGRDGRLRIRPDSDNPDRFRRGSVLQIGDARYTVRRAAPSAGGVLLVKLEGLNGPEEAAPLVQHPIIVPVSEIPPLPEDAYYYYQLLDMEVVTPEGVGLGTLTEVVATGANDVYVVTSSEHELLLPAIGDVVLAVDLERRRMTVVVPEGLEPRVLRARKPSTRRPTQRRRRRNPPAASRESAGP